MECYETIFCLVRKRLDGELLRSPDLSDLELKRIISETVSSEHMLRQSLASIEQQDLVIQKLIDDLIGLGPLEQLLRDPSVTEIMINRFDEIYIEVEGKLEKSTLAFSSEESLRTAIERAVSPLGRRVDLSSPMVDARLPCGSRINAALPPVALKGACMTVRKFTQEKPDLDFLIKQKSCNESIAELLKMFVRYRCNIIVSGGTGSGKTTLLNVISGFSSSDERIITIEDSAELQLNTPHLVRLESRPANQEGKGEVTIRQLLTNALRMRPDRIIIGECRGKESLDMLQAMNTGHAGSMTTLHANSPVDALRRLETMVLMAEADLPLDAIRQQIVAAIEIIVQVKRLESGRRVITSVSELQGIEGGCMQVAQLARYDESRDEHEITGEIPKVVNKFSESVRNRAVEFCNPGMVDS